MPDPPPRRLLLSIAGACAAVVALLGLVHVTAPVGRIDRAVARWAAANVDGAAEGALRAVTWLGTWPAVVLVALAVIALEWRRRGPSWAPAAFLAAACLGCLGITQFLKHLVGRERPPFRPEALGLDPAFPSGHTSQAAAVLAASALLAAAGRSARTRRAIWAVALGLSVAVAASRVLLALHWLTDAVAGLAVGWGWAALCAAAAAATLRRCSPASPSRSPATSSPSSSPPSSSTASTTGTTSAG